MQLNAYQLERTVRAANEDSPILRLSFLMKVGRRRGLWHYNAPTHTRRHVHVDFHLTKTPSPETLKYLQLDAPQNNWDGTWSKNTHTCTERSKADSHLRVSDVEMKHLEGREDN